MSINELLNIAPLLGVFGSYYVTKYQVNRLEKDIEQLKAQHSSINDQLIAISTKIDLILQNKIK